LYWSSDLASKSQLNTITITQFSILRKSDTSLRFWLFELYLRVEFIRFESQLELSGQPAQALVMKGVQLRPVAQKLARIVDLDPRPLTEARPPGKRLVGNCRDFSVMLTAILRRQGVPARARCGFGRYFIPSGQADPDTFGIFDMHGLWFVRVDFVRDVASL
jgi:hypothetical protein